MIHFGNLVPLETSKSCLYIPIYLVGYIVAEGNKVIVYTWEIMDLLSVLSKEGGSILVNV